VSQELRAWFASVADSEWLWYAKYLAANDTLATGAHQAGFYIPKFVFRALFPTLAASSDLNPSASFVATVAREGRSHTVRAIWYNNRVAEDGTRDECRITGWGGRSSPLLDPESTGALAIFAFLVARNGSIGECRVWVCRDLAEEEVALDRLGGIEPGGGRLLAPTGEGAEATSGEPDQPCHLDIDELPPSWRTVFPEAMELVSASVTRLPSSRSLSVDARLLRRRDCEFALFRSVEEAFVLPHIRDGFPSVDAFVSFAGMVTNRRKARSGRSLELQIRQILEEEGVPYSHGEVSENGKQPDFVFPSIERYRESSWPASRLRMLASKTTCKDRWRQVIDEAERIPVKHLLTLQEGVSEQQYAQMERAGIQLVVPDGLQSRYPGTIRPKLSNLQQFLEEVRTCTRAD
jgi:hypothetical protein